VLSLPLVFGPKASAETFDSSLCIIQIAYQSFIIPAEHRFAAAALEAAVRL